MSSSPGTRRSKGPLPSLAPAFAPGSSYHPQHTGSPVGYHGYGTRPAGAVPPLHPSRPRTARRRTHAASACGSPAGRTRQ